MNAVRAIRRMSSFGASLLGKSGSVLREKKGSMDSPNLSIAEDSEESKDDKLVASNGEEGIVKGEEDKNESKENTEKLLTVKEKIILKKPLENDSSRSLANISQLRQKFETLSNEFRAPNDSKSDPVGCERKPRSNSLDWDYKKDEIEDSKGSEGSKLKNHNDYESDYQQKGGFFKSKTIERSTKLADRLGIRLGSLSQSMESLLKKPDRPPRPSRISLEKVSNAGGNGNEQVPRSPVETLRDRKKFLNGGVLPKEKDVKVKNETLNARKSSDREIREISRGEKNATANIMPNAERQYSDFEKEDYVRGRKGALSSKSMITGGKAAGSGEYVVMPQNATAANKRTSDNGQHIGIEGDILGETSTLTGRTPSEDGSGGKIEIKLDMLAKEAAVGVRKPLDNTKVDIVTEKDKLADKTKIREILIDRGRKRDNISRQPLVHVPDGSSRSKQKDAEKNSKSNEPLSEVRDDVIDINSNNENGVFASKKVSAVKCLGSTVKKDTITKLGFTGSSGDIATKYVVQSPIKAPESEGKSTDANGDYDMPHKKSWCKSSAAAKRGECFAIWFFAVL